MSRRPRRGREPWVPDPPQAPFAHWRDVGIAVCELAARVRAGEEVELGPWARRTGIHLTRAVVIARDGHGLDVRDGVARPPAKAG